MIIKELTIKYRLVDLLKVVGMASSVYHYHNNQLKKEDKYREIENKILDIYHKHNGSYGYRRIWQELLNIGIKINRKVVHRLMKKLNLKSVIRVKRPKYVIGDENIVVSNLLNQDFYAACPNEKWVTDVTEFRVCGKKVYLSPILDLFNGEIISFSVSRHPDFNMVTDMLNEAFDKIGDVSGLLLHSDQGGLYRSVRYHNLLKDKGIVQSMSRKGNCLDNAVIENFFGHLKSEMFHNRKFDSANEFISKLNDYIYYYNNVRIKTKLKMSPVEYRTHNLIA
jgi:transposase InsO family protein